jgi:hypothetical protein
MQATEPVRPTRRRGRIRVAVATSALAVIAAGCTFVAIPGVPDDCDITPASSFWRSNVTSLPVHPSSSTWIGSAGATKGLKADFGSGLWDGGPIGIPYNVVPGNQPKTTIGSWWYPSQSDKVPYPIPTNPKIEHGGDRHILMVDKDNCRLYELYAAEKTATGWNAGSGATWDMRSNAMRPDTWTSADAAGLPILPGLVRYEEVEANDVHHAIRMTVPVTANTYLWPASHQAGSGGAAHLPMGAWIRLRPDFDENLVAPQARPIVRALKLYGGVIADNGSAWYMSGVPDERWDNDQLRTLNVIKGGDFSVVDASSMKVANGSYESTKAS